MFLNYRTHEMTDDATEFLAGRWWIRSGFAGFNCQANNGFGFETKADAERVVRRYQNH